MMTYRDVKRIFISHVDVGKICAMNNVKLVTKITLTTDVSSVQIHVSILTSVYSIEVDEAI